jgi:hypothetical protein
MRVRLPVLIFCKARSTMLRPPSTCSGTGAGQCRVRRCCATYTLQCPCSRACIAGITINNAEVGFDLTTGGLTNDKQTVGAAALIDTVISNTPVGIQSSVDSAGSLHGSLVLNNFKLNNVPKAVTVAGGKTVLAGGSTTIASWGQGNVYAGTAPAGKFQQDKLAAGTKDKSLLDSAGRIFGRQHPQYDSYDVSQFASARDAGAKGDGVTVCFVPVMGMSAYISFRMIRKRSRRSSIRTRTARLSSLMPAYTSSPTRSLFLPVLAWSARAGVHSWAAALRLAT